MPKAQTFCIDIIVAIDCIVAALMIVTVSTYIFPQSGEITAAKFISP